MTYNSVAESEHVNDYQEWLRRCHTLNAQGPFVINGQSHLLHFVDDHGTAALFNQQVGWGIIFRRTVKAPV